MAAIDIRCAESNDVPELQAMIQRSVRALSIGYYDSIESEAALRHIVGIDSALVADRSYFVASIDGSVAGCGGWSRHASLYGGDQRATASQVLLRAGHDAARIRAFFIAPEFARQGVGRALFEHAREAARSAGFTALELVATLPGVPFYRSLGFQGHEDIVENLPGAVALRLTRMSRPV